MLFSLIDRLQKLLPQKKIDIFGKDSLLNSTLPYYSLIFFMTIGFYIGVQLKSPFFTIFIIYGFIPLVDEIVSHDWKNPQPQQVQALLKRNWKYQFPLYLTVLIDWIMFFYTMNFFANFQWTLSTAIQGLGILIIFSNLNAAQFAVAHQILHKPGWKRLIGTLHMLKTLNIHFTYEHIFGHHRKVATPEDPASASKGDNVYTFFLRSYFGAYKSVYQMENQAGKPIYKNMAVLSILSSVAFTLAIFKFYNMQCGILFVISAFAADFYLEVINYIEHYGLRRKKNENGEYENVKPVHSWNAPHRYSNYLLFKLQRHSDHHHNSTKPYQILQSIEYSPQLPHGYTVMTMLALFPGLFQGVMDPLVDSYTQQKEDIKERYEQSIVKMRKFVIEIGITTLGLSLVMKVLGI